MIAGTFRVLPIKEIAAKALLRVGRTPCVAAVRNFNVEKLTRSLRKMRSGL
jgi:hypothetical protein